MRYIFALVLVLCITGSPFAQNLLAPDNLFAGLGMEANAHTRKGFALSGGILFGLDLTSQFAVGMKTAYSHNLDTVSAVEFQIFHRYYPTWLLRLINFEGFFVQQEAGCVIFYEFGEAFPAYINGLTLGWRFKFKQNWFWEPALRLGYPHIWGVGVIAGYSYSLNNDQ